MAPASAAVPDNASVSNSANLLIVFNATANDGHIEPSRDNLYESNHLQLDALAA